MKGIDRQMHLYEILNVDRNASSEEMEEAYSLMIGALPRQGFRGWMCRAFGLAYPFDRAHSILSDSARRRQYDEDPDPDQYGLWLCPQL